MLVLTKIHNAQGKNEVRKTKRKQELIWKVINGINMKKKSWNLRNANSEKNHQGKKKKKNWHWKRNERKNKRSKQIRAVKRKEEKGKENYSVGIKNNKNKEENKQKIDANGQRWLAIKKILISQLEEKTTNQHIGQRNRNL